MTDRADNVKMAKTSDLDKLDPPTPKNYVPHKWPAPSQDLWSQIRDGLQLKSGAKRRSVRIWTQYYATHTNHLSQSLQRARPFLWHVVKQVEKRHMPTEIALLPIVESGYDPSAKSYVGASGMWQFMPGTADYMNLPRDWWYDGRDDPIASTDAALNYLQSLNQRYDGDWLLALAAYNAGPGRVDKAIAQAESEGQSTSYWDLQLPQETTEYVPKLLALRRILKTPARFGVDWPSLANKPRTKLVKLPGQTELKVAAHMLDMSQANLRRLNPGMRRWASEPGGHDELLVPADKAAAFQVKLAHISPADLVDSRTHTVHRGDVLGRIAHTYGVSVAALREANGLNSNTIRVGQRLTIPGPGGHEKAPPAEPTQTYVVQSGDTLWNIADRYSVSVASLRRANGSSSNTLHPGDSLSIPGSAKLPAPSTYVVQTGDTLWSIAQTNHVSVSDLRQWNRIPSGMSLHPGRTIALDGPAPLPDYYEVEPGDSLWSIASRFSMQVATLRSLNDMSSNSTIQPGERLRLQPLSS
ncbi:MAG: LysM peptidoglycan-binding domain-containing protein [Salinisphaera sp.]|nr:LysM peptidoglycan-binding domain-containing protein [Salinisphaera sp.]